MYRNKMYKQLNNNILHITTLNYLFKYFLYHFKLLTFKLLQLLIKVLNLQLNSYT